jgi:type I restriction enzyme, S subunit
VTIELPSGWKMLALDDIGFVQTGIAVNGQQERVDAIRLPYLRVANVQDGHIDLSEIKHITVSQHQVDRYALQEGDVLMTEGGDFDKLGRGAVWKGEIARCLHQNHVFAVRPDQRKIISEFLAAYCESPVGKRYFLSCSKQTTNLASINSTQLKEMPIVVPPLAEQERIVAALSTCDHAIDQTERLISAKRRRFEAARIRLIETPQTAGKENNPWVSVAFGEIAEELKQRNAAGHGPDRVMGVIKGDGLVPMRSHVMAADLRRYLIVPPQAIAYNPMRLNIGSIAASKYDQDVLVSPDYVVFRARKGRADSHFLRFLIGTKRWRDHLVIVGSGSVRTRIYFDGLGEMVLRVPDIREQKRIGQFLTAIEQDLTATIESASALRTQKRGLMQKLLTGEWRLGKNIK